MKLRNKETGEITEATITVCKWTNDYEDMLTEAEYENISDVMRDWEDYTPKEPIIKDEKFRQVVRGWADYNGVEEAFYFTYGDGRSRLDASTASISFYNELRDLKEWKKYTIAELCGKEKE